MGREFEEMAAAERKVWLATIFLLFVLQAAARGRLQRRQVLAAAARHKGEAFKQMHVLFVLEQSAM